MKIQIVLIIFLHFVLLTFISCKHKNEDKKTENSSIVNTQPSNSQPVNNQQSITQQVSNQGSKSNLVNTQKINNLPIKKGNSQTKKDLKVKPFQNSTSVNDWGYDIYLIDKLFIHQPNIPAISGSKGFLSEKDAIKVGNLMIKKVNNNEMPPSISIKELDSLKIKY